MAKILLVDDDPDIRSLLKIMLTGEGHEVVEATDGAEALEVAQTQPFDLVLTDLIMPDKEGIETIMELRKKFPRIRIIAMSGGGVGRHGDYLGLAGKLGAMRTLAKPFGVNELKEAVDAVLGAP
jgi:DNA-binding response OmpR family regulator